MLECRDRHSGVCRSCVRINIGRIGSALRGFISVIERGQRQLMGRILFAPLTAIANIAPWEHMCRGYSNIRNTNLGPLRDNDGYGNAQEHLKNSLGKYGRDICKNLIQN